MECSILESLAKSVIDLFEHLSFTRNRSLATWRFLVFPTLEISQKPRTYTVVHLPEVSAVKVFLGAMFRIVLTRIEL